MRPKPQAFLAAQDAVVAAAEATGREIDLAVRNLIEEGSAAPAISWDGGDPISMLALNY